MSSNAFKPVLKFLSSSATPSYSGSSGRSPSLPPANKISTERSVSSISDLPTAPGVQAAALSKRLTNPTPTSRRYRRSRRAGAYACCKVTRERGEPSREENLFPVALVVRSGTNPSQTSVDPSLWTTVTVMVTSLVPEIRRWVQRQRGIHVIETQIAARWRFPPWEAPRLFILVKTRQDRMSRRPAARNGGQVRSLIRTTSSIPTQRRSSRYAVGAARDRSCPSLTVERTRRLPAARPGNAPALRRRRPPIVARAWPSS